MGAEYASSLLYVIALSVIAMATSAPFVSEMNASNASTATMSSDAAERERGSATAADRQVSPAFNDNAMQAAHGNTKHVSFGRRRLKRAVSLQESSGSNEGQKFHKARVGEAKLSQRLPPHVDDYDHLNHWDDWDQDQQQQQQRYRELAAGGISTLGRMRPLRTAAKTASGESQAAWSEGGDRVKQRVIREFDSIGGGLVIPDMRRREFDSFAGEIPAKKRLQSDRGFVVGSRDWRREFDSIDGGLVVPDRRRDFDSLAGEIPAKKRQQSYRDSADDMLTIPDVPGKSSSFESGILVPGKHRREFDSLAGEIPYVKRRQLFARSRSIAVDALAPAAATAGRRGSNVDLAQLTAVRRNTFDSLGGGLIPVKRRADHALFTDDDDSSEQVLQHGSPSSVDGGWNEIETETDLYAPAQAVARREFDSLGGGLVLPI